MRATCKPCKENMSLIQDEDMGQYFRCSQCGTEVAVDLGKNQIEVGRVGREGTI